jgi:ribonuclease D
VATHEPYIDDDTQLSDYLKSVTSAAPLALDTEFVREKTYYPKLCLIQIANGESIACIDCIADLDHKKFFDHLLREEHTWIVHSGRQDLEVIHQHSQRVPAQLIDTQIAAGLIGYPPQVGLQEILADALGVHLAKEFTRTDWSRRPLPDAVLAYARDDVRSLHALWDALAEKLRALGRLDWLAQDCAWMLRQPLTTPTEQIWERLKGLRTLDAVGQGAALTLVAWRETRAQRRDRPRRWILSDEQLLGLARSKPTSLEELQNVPDLPRRLAEQSGEELLAALAAADAPATQAAVARALANEPPERARLRALQAATKSKAEALGIKPELLATKQELTELLTDRRPTRIFETWRAAELAELIDV